VRHYPKVRTVRAAATAMAAKIFKFVYEADAVPFAKSKMHSPHLAKANC